MSCNGCRVLRKGCSDSCALRPCLQWIEGAEAQGHATVFVAKFFGRAGLMGFINAVPENQRPALFRSLLYEACGRTVNPVYGAVGLLWSGNWHVCQAAVDNVLRGGSLKPPGPPAAVPCYGPMPNLPRVHFPISQGKSDHPATMEDLKRVKLEQLPLRSYVQHHEENAAAAAGGFVSLAGDVKPSVVAQQKSVFFDQQTEYYRRNGAASDRQQIQKQGVKKEREETPEVIVPIARRARLRLDEDSNYCCLGSSKAAPPETMVVNEEEIDLDLTLSSHPLTPQLLPRPPQQGGGGGSGGRRVPSPLLSCSNSMSSEGSVTSLDTGDFTAASRNGSCSMDFLRQMENKQQQQLQLPKS